MRRKSFKAEFLSKSGAIPKTSLVAVRLPQDLEDKLKALAKAKGTTFSKTLIEALRYALDDEDDSRGKGGD
jgi:predicted DNA-binding protein